MRRRPVYGIEPAVTSRYRFGLKSADFLVCARCGVYVGAFMPEAEGGVGGLAVLNLNALDERARFVQPAQPMDYDGEDLESRLARRRARWTPAELHEYGAGSRRSDHEV